MAWKIEEAAAIEGDTAALFDHLVESHLSAHHSLTEALDLAAGRIDRIRGAYARITSAPHRGGRVEIAGEPYRWLTLDRTIYWFRIEADRQTIVIEGIFHGGQDHLGRMLSRLTAEGD